MPRMVAAVREVLNGAQARLPAIPPGLKRKAFEAELVGRIEDASARLLREAQKPGSSSIGTVTHAVTEK